MQGKLHMYINGKWAEGAGGERSIIDPSNQSVLTVVSEASPQQVEEAVLAAKRAFEKTDWSVNTQLKGQPAAQAR